MVGSVVVHVTSTLPVSPSAAVGGKDQCELYGGAGRAQESSPFHSGCPGSTPAGDTVCGNNVTDVGIVNFLAQLKGELAVRRTDSCRLIEISGGRTCGVGEC